MQVTYATSQSPFISIILCIKLSLRSEPIRSFLFDKTIQRNSLTWSDYNNEINIRFSLNKIKNGIFEKTNLNYF